MNRRGRRTTRLAAAGLTALAMLGSLLVVTAAPAAAVPSGTSVSIVKSKCVNRDSNGKPTFAWVGSGWQVPSKKSYLATQVKGKMFACFWKFKFSDKDKKYDYWGASVQTYWVSTNKKGKASFAAQATHQIASNKTAKGGVFDGTNTFKSKNSCGVEVSLGVQLGIFSVSAPVQACNKYEMKATRVSDTAGSWKIPKVGGFSKIETVYMQKVPQGKKPTFNMSANVPRYGYKWSGDVWKPTVVFKTLFVAL